MALWGKGAQEILIFFNDTITVVKFISEHNNSVGSLTIWLLINTMILDIQILPQLIQNPVFVWLEMTTQQFHRL